MGETILYFAVLVIEIVDFCRFERSWKHAQEAGITTSIPSKQLETGKTDHHLSPIVDHLLRGCGKRFVPIPAESRIKAPDIRDSKLEFAVSF